MSISIECRECERYDAKSERYSTEQRAASRIVRSGQPSRSADSAISCCRLCCCQFRGRTHSLSHTDTTCASRSRADLPFGSVGPLRCGAVRSGAELSPPPLLTLELLLSARGPHSRRVVVLCSLRLVNVRSAFSVQCIRVRVMK